MGVRLRSLALLSLIVVPVLYGQGPEVAEPNMAAQSPAVPPEHERALAPSLREVTPPSAPTDPGRGPRRPLDVSTTAIVDGTHGEVNLTSPTPFTSTGVLLKAYAPWNWIVAQTGTADYSSGFTVNNSSNTELFRVRSDGKVGIGTTNPENALDVMGHARFRGGVAEQVAAMTLSGTSATGAEHRWTHFVGSSGGMIGIPPNAYELYEYPRSIVYPNPGWANLRLRIEPTTAAYPNPGLFRITDTGSVGINGRTGDYASLEVAAPNATTNTWATPSSYRGFILSNGVDSNLVLRTFAAGLVQMTTDTGIGALSFATGQFTEAMRIDSGGRVGIGTAAPDNLGGYRIPLTVTGPSWNYVRLIAAGSPIAGGIVFDRAGTTGFITAFNNDGRFRIAPVPAMTDVAVTNAKDQFAGITVDTAGNVSVGGPALNNATFTVQGNVEVTGNIAAKYQDVAEWVPASDDLSPGTVVVLNRDRVNEVTASFRSYDTAVAGVVSAQPGVILGEAGLTKEMIATTGRVRVKVDATQHPIAIGDLLVSSSKAGVAMRSEPIQINGRAFHQPGTIIGKALEPLQSGTGEILVLLSMQ